MARRPNPHPTDTELEILHALWKTGPASLGVIHRELLAHRDVAKTTVATMLNVMLQKRLVRRKEAPRGFLWSAVVSRDEAATGMLGKLIDRIFDGSAQRMIAHLVEGDRLSDEDLEQIRRLVVEHRQSRRRKRD